MTVVKKSDIEKKIELDSIKEGKKALAAAELAYPHYAGTFTSAVKVPGVYNVYAIGTIHDLTIMVWLHENEAIVKMVAW